ncbi:MAG TPA: branched-chain amino acid ABC transporter permease [Symbiobacteriaceae bacterium]|nr:branched-chain amino acid ABC transporter permease [Symbiobacteriaceae bacterium]
MINPKESTTPQWRPSATPGRRLPTSLLAVAGLALAAGLWLYLAVSGEFAVSMAAVAGVVVVLVYLDKVGLADRLYELHARHKAVSLLSFGLVLLVLPIPMRQSPYLIHIAVMACLAGIVALGLNFQMGSTDMVNFACGAFFGMGAYSSALLATKTGLSPWLGLPVAVVTTVVLAYVVGVATLKTKGYYLSLVTMALQLVFGLLLVNTDAVGGPNGIAAIPPYSIGPLSFRDSFWLVVYKLPYQALYFYLTAAMLLVCGYVASRLHLSRVGLAWNTIGEDEIAGNCQGINPARAKLIAFCMGGAFSGLAGALYAHYISFIGPEDFSFSKSLIIISSVILGGPDNVLGVVVGSVLLTLIDEKLGGFTDYRMLLYGLILLCVLLFRPDGLMPKRVRRYDLQLPK